MIAGKKSFSDQYVCTCHGHPVFFIFQNLWTISGFLLTWFSGNVHTKCWHCDNCLPCALKMRHFHFCTSSRVSNLHGSNVGKLCVRRRDHLRETKPKAQNKNKNKNTSNMLPHANPARASSSSLEVATWQKNA